MSIDDIQASELRKPVPPTKYRQAMIRVVKFYPTMTALQLARFLEKDVFFIGLTLGVDLEPDDLPINKLGMTLGDLNDAMERDIQLHEQFEIIYVVDGWEARYSTDDGNTYQEFKSESPIEAMIACFSEVRNIRGRR